MEKGMNIGRRGKARGLDERDEPRSLTSAGLHIGEPIQNT